jgi:D-cysteine desulfhydrase family pyridoxal phosphate-dependent enzyme
MSLTDQFPSVALAHKPTPLELLSNLSRETGVNIWVKRDDCTGLAFGGNKARQLEYYIGQAVSEGADILLTTGAVQSNHVRCTVAAARKLGLDVEVQLEHRVDTQSHAYHHSGNPFVVELMGATAHHFPVGEDENAADDALYRRAEELRSTGRTPYVIPLANAHAPWGALGYVEAAEELLAQQSATQLSPAAWVVASGSASTHAGLLLGLAAHDSTIDLYGICVRRAADAQKARVWNKVKAVAGLFDSLSPPAQNRVRCDDRAFAPGYGVMSETVRQTLLRVARSDGLLLDPTYTAKSFAGLMGLIEDGSFAAGSDVVYVHTGGTPSIFAYPEILTASESG